MSGASTLLGSQPTHKPSEAERQTIERNFDLLPLRFEPNQGQSSSDAEFLAQGRGFSALFRENRADFLFTGHPATSRPLSVRKARKLGAKSQIGDALGTWYGV
jgi:hypothetical protein